jgi:hypothetical protein
MMSSPFGCGGRFGGFGSESMGNYSGDYGWSASGYDRGGLLPLLWKIVVTHGQSTEAGASNSGFRDSTPRRTNVEEYDAGDDETSRASPDIHQGHLPDSSIDSFVYNTVRKLQERHQIPYPRRSSTYSIWMTRYLFIVIDINMPT